MSEDDLNEQLEAEFVCTMDALDDYLKHHERLRCHLKEVIPCTWSSTCPTFGNAAVPWVQVMTAVAGVLVFGEGSLQHGRPQSQQLTI